MSIDSIGLLAQQSYTQIQDRPKLSITETSKTNAVDFHSLVNRQFNSFSKMSPAQILNHIQGSKQTGSTSEATAPSFKESAAINNIANGLRDSINTQEQTVRKSLIGEASLVDVVTATTKAKNDMETTVKIRDEFLKAFDKVMNMSM